jgi:hypothetical protein
MKVHYFIKNDSSKWQQTESCLLSQGRIYEDMEGLRLFGKLIAMLINNGYWSGQGERLQMVDEGIKLNQLISNFYLLLSTVANCQLKTIKDNGCRKRTYALSASF